VRYFETFRVQHQTPNLQLTHRPIEFGVAIFIISGYFMPLSLAMNTDLMRTPGDQFHPNDAELVSTLQQLHPAMCRLSRIINPHASFTIGHVYLFQWVSDFSQSLRPVALDYSAIVFTHAFILQHGLQYQQGLPMPGEQQAAAGVAIESMHQFDILSDPQ